MTAPAYTLSINTAFAVKRWPEPERWASLVSSLGVRSVQHTLDLTDLDGSAGYVEAQAEAVRAACHNHGLKLHSTFTGLAAYSSNLLLHPEQRGRERAEEWYRRAIDFSSGAGAGSTGGHVGAFSVSDWQTEGRRELLNQQLRAVLQRLAEYAGERGLTSFLVENMAASREPSTMEWMTSLMTDGDGGHVPVRLCLDVGHQCVAGTSGAERDPYEWLERMGSVAPVVHLQQSDGQADHHWPFTEITNAKGRIRGEDVLAALDRSGAQEVALVLEVVPSFEADDDSVLADIAQSVEYWKDAMRAHV